MKAPTQATRRATLANPIWIRRSFEQLHQATLDHHRHHNLMSTVKNPRISQSTGNLHEICSARNYPNKEMPAAAYNPGNIDTQSKEETAVAGKSQQSKSTLAKQGGKENGDLLQADIRQLLSSSRGSPTQLSTECL